MKVLLEYVLNECRVAVLFEVNNQEDLRAKITKHLDGIPYSNQVVHSIDGHKKWDKGK